MPLTDIEARKSKPGDKLRKLSDGHGLQLWIYPDGAKRWRYAYRHEGRQKLLALGVYPEVTLADARTARTDASKLQADGIDPSKARQDTRAAKIVKNANTFDAIAIEVADKKRREGLKQDTLDKFEWYMSKARPLLGKRPITDIKAADVLAVLRPIELSGKLHTARKLCGYIGEVFRYAIATSRAENDPTPALKGAIASHASKSRAAIIDPISFGGLLRAIDGYEGMPETRAALKLLALTFTRPDKELGAMEWSEIDFDKALWTIPANKMKLKRTHYVPLAPQALEILGEIRQLTGKGKYVFPSTRTTERHISENTLVGALRRLGLSKEEHCAHGFRTSASTILNACGLWNKDAIERQLSHGEKDTVRGAYNRADHWDERVKMMAYWADRCDEMIRGAQIIPLKREA
jgi:integrase